MFWLRRFLVPLVFLGLLVAGLVFRGPVLSVFRGWRFDANVAKAEAALEDGDLLNANQFASAAWRLERNNLKSVRSLMGLAEQIRSPDLQKMALVRFTHPEATVGDQVAVLQLGLRMGDLVFVGELYEGLPKERRGFPAMRLCNADLLEGQGRALEALDLLRALTKEPDQASAAKLRLTRLLPSLGANPVAQQEAKSLVQEMMTSGDEHALAAFRNLRLLPPPARAPEADLNLLSWLDGQEGAGMSDHLLAAEIELVGAERERREEVIELMIAQYAAEHAGEIARWLLRLGERSYILKLPADDLRREEMLYTAYLQVLIDEERFEETKEWLADPHPKLDGVVLAAVRAGLALREGDESRKVAFWQTAMEKARFANRYGSFFAILRIAERFGDAEMEAKVCRVIASLPARMLPPTRELGFLDLQFGDDPEFLAQMHQRIQATRPEDPVARFNLALLQVLRGEDLESSVARLEELSHRFPKVLRFQCAQALVHLARGEGQAAVELLESQQADWEMSASDFDKAVYVLVLRQQGRGRAADSLERTINATRLPAYQRKWLVAKGVGERW